MKHLALAEFWKHYKKLPKDVQKLADKNFSLLKENPRHPSLHFKKVGKNLWSARVGQKYRAVAFGVPEGFAWFYIGPHKEYERILDQ